METNINEMEKLELWGGTIDDAWHKLKEHSELYSKPFYINFNGHIIISNDTLDEAYVKILGMSKSDWDAREKKEQELREKEEAEYEASIPKLTEEWIEKGRAILDESFWTLWEQCVPTRLGDLYHGMELGCTLDIVSILNKDGEQKDVFEEAKEILVGQGHSGMSWCLMLSMLRSFHKDGNTFVDWVKENQ